MESTFSLNKIKNNGFFSRILIFILYAILFSTLISIMFTIKIKENAYTNYKQYKGGFYASLSILFLIFSMCLSPMILFYNPTSNPSNLIKKEYSKYGYGILLVFTGLFLIFFISCMYLFFAKDSASMFTLTYVAVIVCTMVAFFIALFIYNFPYTNDFLKLRNNYKTFASFLGVDWYLIFSTLSLIFIFLSTIFFIASISFSGFTVLEIILISILFLTVILILVISILIINLPVINAYLTKKDINLNERKVEIYSKLVNEAAYPNT